MTLRRRQTDLPDDAFEAFAEDVRASVSSPAEETARRHLAAMRAAVEESRLSALQAPRTRRRSAGPLRPVLRLGALAAGALVAFSGVSTALAGAGVELPGALRAPFDVVGIQLPNQPDDAERATPPAGERPAKPEPDDAPARSSEPPRPGEREGDRPGRRRGKDAGGRSGGKPGSRGKRGKAGGGSGGQHGGSGSAGNGRANGNGTSGNPGRGSRGRSQGKAKGRPANPAPRRSARRGAGPARPIKPSPPRDRATKNPKKVPPPAVTEPAPDGTTTTTTSP